MDAPPPLLFFLWGGGGGNIATSSRECVVGALGHVSVPFWGPEMYLFAQNSYTGQSYISNANHICMHLWRDINQLLIWFYI